MVEWNGQWKGTFHQIPVSFECFILGMFYLPP